MSPLPDHTARIRSLNDQLRTHIRTRSSTVSSNARIVLTDGCLALDSRELIQLLDQVATFTAFDDGNDPHGEHDFGAVSVAGERYFFKIDYYDLAMRGHSPDPADARQTMRVLTIMRADEY